MTTHSPQFNFPTVSPSPLMPDADSGTLMVIPYLKGRPLGTKITLPPSVTKKMEAGANLAWTLEGVGSFGLLAMSPKDMLQPEKAIASYCAGRHKEWPKVAILIPDEGYIALDLQLLTSYLTDGCRDHYSLKSEQKFRPLSEIDLIVDALNPAIADQLARGVALGKARAFVRTIVDMPANFATPTAIPELFLSFITQQTLEHNGLRNIRMDFADMTKMGALNAVAQGSSTPAQFLWLGYNVEANDKLIVADVNLVGKGVTFDSGGISIKPSTNMHHMKTDMGGAATVMGSILYAAMSNSSLKLRAFMPLTENMPSAGAVKPGDVVTAYSGKTIEIIDTDAEGRLVLADALAYAAEFASECTIDLATLTGACRMALGAVHCGLFTDSKALAAELTEAGKLARDKTWQLPMDEDYRYMLESNVADLSNLSASRGGGATNGAMFLKEFVKHSDRWAHLDIAAVAAVDGKATSRPLGLLAKFLDGRNAAIGNAGKLKP